MHITHWKSLSYLFDVFFSFLLIKTAKGERGFLNLLNLICNKIIKDQVCWNCGCSVTPIDRIWLFMAHSLIRTSRWKLDAETVGQNSHDNDLTPGNHLSHQRSGSSSLALFLRRLLLCSILLISFTNCLHFSNFRLLIHCSGLPSPPLQLQLSRTLISPAGFSSQSGETDSEC